MASTMSDAAAAAAAAVPKLKALLLSGVPESALQVLNEASGYEVDICTEQLTEAQLAKRIEEVNVVGLADRNVEVLTDEIIRSAHRLLAIGCFCADASAVDVKCASDMGVPVFTSPYGDSHSRAETVIALLVMLARQLGDRNREMHKGNWQKVSDHCYEVRGKKLGIIGYGHVGSQLGVLAEFLGLKVIWYDHQALMPIGTSEAVESLQQLLQEADFVSVHVPEVPENVSLIGAEQLALMKRGSYIINTSFGEAVRQLSGRGGWSALVPRRLLRWAAYLWIRFAGRPGRAGGGAQVGPPGRRGHRRVPAVGTGGCRGERRR